MHLAEVCGNCDGCLFEGGELLNEWGSWTKEDLIECRVYSLNVEKESFRYIKIFRNTKNVGTRIVHGNFLTPCIMFQPSEDEFKSAEVEVFFSNLTLSDNKGKSNWLKIVYVT